MKILSMLAVSSLILGAFSFAHAKDLNPGKNKVTYFSGGERVVADVYLPKDYVKGEKRPAIVITPPASGVKEQTAGLYAKKLSDKGFVTLAFDPRGFGESEGHEVLLNPYRIAEDAMSAVSFMRSLNEVDPNKVYNMGICAGSGYAAYATAFDARPRAVIMVSPYLTSSDDFLKAVKGSTAAVRKFIMPGAAAARQKYFETGEDMFFKIVPTTAEEKKKARPMGVGMMEYYLPGKPGDVPNWKNKLSLQSGDAVLSFSVYNFASWFDAVPVYMAYGKQAISAEGAKRFYDQINGPKQLLVIDGAGHFDMYWRPECVDPTVLGISKFLKKQDEKKS